MGLSHDSPAEDPLPTCEPLKFMSFNALRLHAVPVAKKHLGLSPLDYLIDELKSSSVHFAGIQEPHFRPATSEPCCVGKKRCDYHRAFANLKPLRYASLFNDSPSRRGGVGADLPRIVERSCRRLVGTTCLIRITAACHWTAVTGTGGTHAPSRKDQGTHVEKD